MILFASLLTLCLIVFNGIILITVLQIVVAFLIAKMSKPIGGLFLICVVANAVATDVAALLCAILLICLWHIILAK